MSKGLFQSIKNDPFHSSCRLSRLTSQRPVTVMTARATMSMTPKAAVAPAPPCSHRSHMITESTLLFLVPSINGIENARSECDATQIHPLMKAGRTRGNTIRRRICRHCAPETSAASSNSR